MRFFFFLILPSLLLGSAIADENTDLVGILSEQMNYLANKDVVISQNIANADTPKYTPIDIEHTRQGQDNNRVDLFVTNEAHISTNEIAKPYKTVSAEVKEIKSNGNGVTIEDELAKKSKNAMEMQKIANLYAKSKGMMKFVLTGQK